MDETIRALIEDNEILANIIEAKDETIKLAELKIKHLEGQLAFLQYAEYEPEPAKIKALELLVYDLLGVDLDNFESLHKEST